MTLQAVRNDRPVRVECAGVTYPARSTTTVDLSAGQAAAVAAHRHLTLQPVEGGDLTVAQLRDALKAKGLPTSGKKKELAARLAAAGDNGGIAGG